MLYDLRKTVRSTSLFVLVALCLMYMFTSFSGVYVFVQRLSIASGLLIASPLLVYGALIGLCGVGLLYWRTSTKIMYSIYALGVARLMFSAARLQFLDISSCDKGLLGGDPTKAVIESIFFLLLAVVAHATRSN